MDYYIIILLLLGVCVTLFHIQGDYIKVDGDSSMFDGRSLYLGVGMRIGYDSSSIISISFEI